jgi:hypothetical protein
VGVGRVGGAGDRLDQPVDGHRAGGERDHAVGGQQGERVIDGERVIIEPVGQVAGDRVRGQPCQRAQDIDCQRLLAGDGSQGQLPDAGDGALSVGFAGRVGCGGRGEHAAGVAAQPV